MNAFIHNMIGGITLNRDINIFLEPQKIEKLKSKTIHGILIQVSEPENQSPMKLVIDAEKSKGKITVEEKPNYCVYVHPQHYDELVKTGRTGTRYDSLGDQIGIFDESRIKYIDKTLDFELSILKSYCGSMTYEDI